MRGRALLLCALLGVLQLSSVQPYQIAGGAGHALFFNGTDADAASWRIPVETQPILDGTIEFWLQIRDPYQTAHPIFVVSSFDSSTFPTVSSPHELALVYDLELGRVQPYLLSWEGEEQCTESMWGAPLSDMEWHHVAMTFDIEAKQVNLYRNGMLKCSVTFPNIVRPKLTVGQMMFGQWPTYFLGGYNERRALVGSMDEFRVWSGVRRPADILAAIQQAVDPEEATLLVYFNFDEPATTLGATDLSLSYMLQEQRERILFLVNSAGQGSIFEGVKLYLGLTQQMRNQLVYETGRLPTPPTRPTFVFSQAWISSGPGNIIKMVVKKENADGSIGFPHVAIPLTFGMPEGTGGIKPSVWVVKSSLPTPGALVYGPTKFGNFGDGTLYQILTNGQRGSALADNQDVVRVDDTSVEIIPNTQNPWCGNLVSNGRCPYGVIYQPQVGGRWEDDNSEVWNEFQFVAYNGAGSYDPATASASEVTPLATVQIFKEKLTGPSQPQDRVEVIPEDTPTVLRLAARDDAGGQRQCRIHTLPNLGSLYELGFEQGARPIYENFERNTSKLVPLTVAPVTLTSDRCVVVYMPEPNTAGERARTSFSYNYAYAENPVLAAGAVVNGLVDIVVEPINDAPNDQPAAQKELICTNTSFTTVTSSAACFLNTSVAAGGVEFSIKLNSFDVDGSPVQELDLPDLVKRSLNRPYYQVRNFPIMGTLYQQANPTKDKGNPVVQNPVIEGFSYVTQVLSGSSQRTTCTVGITPCVDPRTCQAQFCVGAAGNTDFHLSNLVGGVQPFPLLENSAQFSPAPITNSPQDLEGANEFIELEFLYGGEESLFLHTVLIWEQANPGAVVKIEVADVYDGTNTNWRAVHVSEPDPEAAELFSDRIYDPDICPVPVKSKYLRIEVARRTAGGITLKLPAYEAVRVEGFLSVPQGMVLYEDFQPDGRLRDYGRVIYAPIQGVHASGVFDSFAYRTTDCAAWSPEDTEIAIQLAGPVRPEEFCGDLERYPTGARDPVCMGEWMALSTTFGHYGLVPSIYVVDQADPRTAYQDVYIQPDVLFMVEIPLAFVLQDLFAKFGLINGTTDMCNAKTTVSAKMYGITGQVQIDPNTGVALDDFLATKLFKVVKRPRSNVIEIDEGQTLFPTGTIGFSEIEMMTNCASAAFDFTSKMWYGIRASSKFQGPVPLTTETWIETSPSPEAPSIYFFRTRQRLNMMCSMNNSHVNYYDRYPQPGPQFYFLGQGYILPRTAYNETGNCDDRFCNSNHVDYVPMPPSYLNELGGQCTPCHKLPPARVQELTREGGDAFEQLFFREVCSILFEDCDAGKYFDPKAFDLTGDLNQACVRCPRGTYMPTSGRDLECIRCPKGSYFPAEGATQCLQCSESVFPSFSDYLGAWECTSCPRVCAQFDSEKCIAWEPFTLELNQTNELAGRFITDCVCKAGYYEPNRQVGVPCQKCPEGGYCRGGLDLPIPCGPGVYENQTIIQVRDDWQWQCVVEDGGFWMAPGLSQQFWQCEEGVCVGGELGGTEKECEEGLTNRLCSTCADGYFDIGGIICYKCPGGKYSFRSWMATTFGLILVFYSWYIIAVTVSGNFDAIDVTLMYMQILSVIQEFNLNWPSSTFFNWITQIFSLVNFDVDFLKPTCLMEWGYVESYYLQMAFPIIMASFGFMKWLYMKFSMNYFFRKKHLENSTMWMVMRQLFDCSEDTPEENTRALALQLDTSMMMFLQFANINYNILVGKSFEVFQCEQMPNGDYFLSAGPEVLCWQSSHYGMVASSVLSLLINIVGLPLVLFFIVYYSKKHTLMHQPRFFRAFGWIYSRYEMDYSYWETLMLLRRFLIGVCVVFLAERPYIQASMGILAMSGCTMAHFFTRPFRDTALDLLESVSLVSTIFYLICGLLFQSQPRFNTLEYDFMFTGSFNLELFLTISIFVVMLFGIYLSIREIKEKRDKDIAMRVIEDRLVEALEGVGLAYQMMEEDDVNLKKVDVDVGRLGTMTKEAFFQRLRFLDPRMDEEMMDLIYHYVDEDGDGTVDYSEFRNEMWTRRKQRRKRLAVSQLGLANRLLVKVEERIERSGVRWRAWVRFLFGKRFYKSEYANHDQPLRIMSRLRYLMKKKMKEQVEKYHLTLSGSLANSMHGTDLRKFVEFTESDRVLIRYHQVDQWMSASLEDSSEIGIFASNELVMFYRRLLEAIPFLMDWLTTASEADRTAFRRIADSLFACSASVGTKGVYSRTFHHDYRPTMCIWLKDCHAEQQTVFWEFVHAMASINADEERAEALATLRPFTLAGDMDGGTTNVWKPAAQASSQMEVAEAEQNSALKVTSNNSKTGMMFEFNDDNVLSKAEMPEQKEAETKDFKEVKIVGEAKVGKLLVAAGEMPEGVEKCKFQWYRVRTRPDGQSVMEKIGRVNMPHYTVTNADLGCKLRMVVRPYYPDGSAGNISTAITATNVVPL